MLVSRFELPSDGLLAARVCVVQRLPAGDPVRLRLMARRSGAFAAELRRAASVLLAGAEAGLWTGQAHQAFLDRLRIHAPSMSATADRYEHYAAALSSYAGALEETAPRLGLTRRLLQQRCDELARRQQAAPSPAEYQPSADLGADLLSSARDFKARYDGWADALDRCIRAFSEADHADPTRDAHGLRAIEHHVAAAARQQLSPFERAILHPSLHNLSDCLGALNADLTVLGLALLFICPPVGTACLAAATLLAVTRLAVDSTRRARGEQVSAGSLGLELAAAIPMGGGAFRAARAAEDVVHLVPGGGLAAHEGVEGGHTLAKHVGKTEAFLRHRLATEPHLRAASTFYDRQTAENAIAQLLDDNGSGVSRWLAGTERSLSVVGSMSQGVGTAITRTSAAPVEAAGVKVILKRSSSMPTGFRIHTAMVIE
jgi:uncharacterized protein YukE